MAIKQYLTYQHNVQKYFREHREKYDGIIIPLSIATTFPSGTYGFIRALCASDGTKHYAIDPRNALFQKRWDRKHVRAPHVKMTTVLGEPYKTTGIVRQLTTQDFADEAVLEESVRQCTLFQQQFRVSADDERKLQKYKKMLGIETIAHLGNPQFLIPPYFQFESLADPWYEISRRSILAAQKHAAGIPIWPVLHFGNWTGVANWNDVFTWLYATNIGPFWLYPNNFREHDAPLDELISYRNTVVSAVAADVTPQTLFGGYFAILLSYYGLVSFGNGIGYGEWRDSGFHKGGTAATRVYMLKLHRFLDAPAAQALIDSDPDYFGNDTEILAAYVDGGIPLDKMTLQEGLDHFMECRRMEIDFVAANAKAAAVAELTETYARLELLPLEREKFGASLNRWATVLNQA